MHETTADLGAAVQRLREENEAMTATLLRREVERLQAENAALRARLDAQAESVSTSRREVLVRIGALAGLAATAGAAAIGLDGASVAAVGTPLNAGDTTTVTASTELRYNFPIGGSPRSHVFAVQDGVWGVNVPAASNDPNGTRAAIGGYAGNDAILGGFFQTNAGNVGAAGARAVGVSANSYGLRMQGRKAALLIDRFDNELAPPAKLDPHLGGEISFDAAGDLWFCAVSGSPGVWRKLSGPATSGQLHLLASPVRCYDSRDGYSPLGVVKGLLTEPRLVDCRVTSDGGPPVVPVDATGLVVNVTVVDTTGAGYVAVYPGGSTYPGTSLLNYGVGDTVANSTSVGCGPGATVTVRCGGAGVGNLIIDVMGYYR